MMESASLAERIEKCERILKENSNSQVFASLADAYRSKGDLDQAFRVCRQGLRLHPEYGPGHLVMAKINFERKMFDWAEQELVEAVTLDGETRATQQLRVEVFIAKGNFVEAENAIKKLRAAGLNPMMIQDLQQRLERQKKETRRRRVDQTSNHGPAPAGGFGPGGGAGRPVAVAAEPQMITLSQALDRLAQFAGVRCVVCTNHDGTVIDNRGTAERDCAEIAAFGVEMCRNAESEAAYASLGEPHQIWVETQNAMILIVKLSRYGIVLMCDKEVNSGSMRLALDEIIDRLLDS
ncbi:MAG: hypothetical protein WBP29_11115 [Candidatus Zixiibacteriota bacterium]